MTSRWQLQDQKWFLNEAVLVGDGKTIELEEERHEVDFVQCTSNDIVESTILSVGEGLKVVIEGFKQRI